MMRRILEERVKRLDSLEMEPYYGIINTPTKKLNIKMSHSDNESLFVIKYLQNNIMSDLRFLPLEIINLITSFGDDYISITTKVIYPSDYPFCPPIWSLVDVQHNINTSLNLNDYYEYLVDSHNSQYNTDWSPAIHIDKDLLDFIQRVNHFGYLLEHK